MRATADFVKPGISAASLPACCTGRSKSLSLARFQGWENRLCLLVGTAANSISKDMEGGRQLTGNINDIHLPHKVIVIEGGWVMERMGLLPMGKQGRLL